MIPSLRPNRMIYSRSPLEHISLAAKVSTHTHGDRLSLSYIFHISPAFSIVPELSLWEPK